jgi:hypothetical protein
VKDTSARLQPKTQSAFAFRAYTRTPALTAIAAA